VFDVYEFVIPSIEILSFIISMIIIVVIVVVVVVSIIIIIIGVVVVISIIIIIIISVVVVVVIQVNLSQVFLLDLNNMGQKIIYKQSINNL